MSFKAKTLGLACLVVTSLTGASAQVESESMEDLSAWGTRLQAATEQEFANTLWSRSDNAILLGLLQSTETQDITPVERALLKRLLLSPARRPDGDDAEALLAERIRLLLELGEGDAAAAIAPKRESETIPYSGEALEADLEMARGLEATACDRLSNPSLDSEYWMKLRAVCSVLTGNYAGAELAVEFASARGMNDPWFVEAVFAASGSTPKPPEANLSSGLALALSLAGGFEFDEAGPSPERPDIAAIATERADLDLSVRTRLADETSVLGIMPVETHRDLLLAEAQAFVETAFEEGVEVPDWSAAPELEVFFVLADLGASPGAKAEALANRLSLTLDQSLAAQLATARLHEPDLQALPAIVQTAPYGPVFARAALQLGDLDLYEKWQATFDFAGVPPVSEADRSQLAAIAMITGGDRAVRDQLTVQTGLLEASLEGRDQREVEKLLTGWSGLGLVLSATSREVLRAADPGGRHIDPQVLFMIKSAANSGAIGEAVLTLLAETAGEPEALSGPSLAVLIDILVMMKAGDIASSLALEASGSWTE